LVVGMFVYQGKDENKEKNSAIWPLRMVGMLLTLLASCGLTNIHFTTFYQPLPMGTGAGGVIGALIQQITVEYLNLTGASLMLSALFLTGVTLFTGLSWIKLADTIGRFVLSG